MKISIALCTFNGERFIDEQMASLMNQSRPPDEIIIRDDGSRDGTVLRIQEILERQSIPWRLTVNSSNLGSTRNFEQAIMECTGDVVCLCDQDDIWLADKLATVEHLFEKHPDASYVFSDAELVDSGSRLLATRLWTKVGFDARKRSEFANGDQFRSLLRANFVTGCTAAFRRCDLDDVIPFPTGWIHDHWMVAKLSWLGKKGVPYAQPLIRYRLHEQQQIGHRGPSFLGKIFGGKRVTSKDLEHEISRLGLFLETKPGNTIAAEALQAKIHHFSQRSAMRDRWLPFRFGMALRELVSGRYRYSWSSSAFYRDILGW